MPKRPMMETVEGLDKQAAKRFFGFIRDRHRVYYARYVLRKPPPWTDNEIIRDNFFTNVYRELDPGTQFIVRMLPKARSLRQAVFWALAYRLAFHERSMGALIDSGFMHPDIFKDNNADVRRLLRRIGRPWTVAYIVSAYGKTGDKEDVITDVLCGVADELRKWRKREPEFGGREDFYDWCRANLYGIGRFVSFQGLVDLCYPGTRTGAATGGPGSRWLPWSNDGWVVAGPGAVNGLKHLYSPEAMAQHSTNDLIAYLCRLQGAAMPNLPGWWKGGRRVRVSRSNMQNCCCEFSKYERIRTGGRRRRKFDARSSRVRDLEAEGLGQQLEIV